MTGLQVFLSPHRVLDFVAATSVVAATSLCVLTSCAKTPIVEAPVARANANITPVATNRVAMQKVTRQETQAATRAQRIVSAARLQVGGLYDASYVDLKYPGGDVARGRGACTDVIVRALRAVGFDLQKLIHEDKKRHPNAYPAQ